ncbi:MAG TPA: exosortase system-associated protein, TIGR04073 family [Candidatus Paceibacterota bacterium]|nr:exosortase system-associated protein, TIGR04073 family [Candidatus Paceibacterota bacterium]
MRKTLLLLAGAALVASLGAGCANTERKLSRGFNNTLELVRLSELRRTQEQAALFDGPSSGYGTGFFTGLNRSLARTGIGLYEIVTCPFPPYDPVFTDYLSPNPAYPDSYRPSMVEDAMFSTDANLGFSGGDVAPMIPGSRFRIFDTH